MWLLTFVSFHPVRGQDENRIDSLVNILENEAGNALDSVELLTELIDASFIKPKLFDRYSKIFLELSVKLDSAELLRQAYHHRGNAFHTNGNYSGAIDNFFKSAEIAKQLNMERALASSYLSIAGSYGNMGNPDNAISYYHKSIHVLKGADVLSEEDDSVRLGVAFHNLGDVYREENAIDSAAFYFEESGKIFKAISFTLGMAYYKGSMGIINTVNGEYDKALERLDEAMDILEKENDQYAIASFLPYVGDVYTAKGEYQRAIGVLQRCLQIAGDNNLKKPLREAHFKLSGLYERTGNPREALDHYKSYTIYKDSIQNLEQVQQMAKIRNDFEITQKQSEVDILEKEATIQRLNERRQQIIIYVVVGVLFVVFLIAFGLYRRYRFIRKTRDIINEEKMRSDRLLKNILPDETATELMQKGMVNPKKFDITTVLFTDFKNFSLIAEEISPEKLVDSVDYYFKHFDAIVEKHGLEKIKTIGDAYMCAGGIPRPNKTHAEDSMKAAIEIRDFVEDAWQNPPPNIHTFEVRIGLNSGPVVAGVVGTKKFAYDIWGSTVNSAARMESSSQPGRINVSEHTYDLLKDQYNFTYRGEVEVKNGQMLKMYFAEVESTLEERVPDFIFSPS